MQPLVIVTRTNRIESIHEGSICVTDHNNHPIYSIGNPKTTVYFRSAAKPIQAVALVHSGAMEQFNITLEELAVVCSSHSGEDFHRDAVSSILHKIGLTEKNLLCGIANPYNRKIHDTLIQSGQRPSPLYNCCSGKHAGMLALCQYYHYPTEDYNRPEHPIQQLIRKTIANLLELDVHELPIGIDGCGVPTFLLTLHQASYLYSLLAQGTSGRTQYHQAFGQIQKAMTSFPKMVNGDHEFCTDLITITKGKVIGKVGAEGIYCVAIPDRQLGICLKIADGNERGVYPVIVHVLRQLRVLTDEEMEQLQNWAYPPEKNHLGKIIGYRIPMCDIYQKDAFPHIQTGDKFEWEGDHLWNH